MGYPPQSSRCEKIRERYDSVESINDAFIVGLHRYTYLLYKQTAPIQFEKIKNTDRFPRRKWKAREFAKANKLEGPLAGNFYQAEWDEWVPNIHKQLGIA